MKILETYSDGRISVYKTCRSDKICSGCGATILKGTLLKAIQHLVVFRKKYYKDEDWFCENCEAQPRPLYGNVNEWI